MNKAEKKKKLAEILAKQDVANFEADLTRARAVTVGTCFGGTTEVSMRAPNGTSVWCPMQPVEVIELIHQLAANVGCHINLQPRKDFSSWRDWKYTDEQLEHYKGPQALPGVGWAPYANELDPHKDKGQVLPPPEQQPGVNINRSIKDDAMAIKKSGNKRSVKRASKTS